MKKTILFSASALAFTIGTILLSGCAKEDSTAPVITVTGGNAMTISLNSTFTAPAATAEDDEDGDITTSITTSGTVDEDLTGDYTVTYSATDAAGNVGTADLVVTVRNDAYALESDYDGNETDALGPYTYSGNTNPAKVVQVTASTTVNNRVTINRLGDFANNAVYMTITGTNITIPSQTVPSVGTGTMTCDVHDRQSSGTGTVTTTGFTLTYNDSKVTPCSGTRTAVAATFTKK